MTILRGGDIKCQKLTYCGSGRLTIFFAHQVEEIVHTIPYSDPFCSFRGLRNRWSKYCKKSQKCLPGDIKCWKFRCCGSGGLTKKFAPKQEEIPHTKPYSDFFCDFRGLRKPCSKKCFKTAIFGLLGAARLEGGG